MTDLIHEKQPTASQSFTLFIIIIILIGLIGGFVPNLIQAISEYTSSSGLVIIGGSISLLLAIVILSDIRPGLLIITLWIPVELWISKDLGLISQQATWFDEGILVLISLGWIFRKFSRGEGISRTPIDIPLMIFSILGLISTIINQVTPLVGLFGFRAPLQYALIFYAIANSPPMPSYYRKIVNISLFFIILQIPLSLYQIVARIPMGRIQSASEIGYQIRAFGMFGHTNALGGVLVIFIAIMVGWILFYPGRTYRNRVLQLFLMGAFLVTLVMTFSRQAWIGLFLGLVIVLFLLRRYKFALLLILGALLLIVTVWIAVPGFVERTTTQIGLGESYVRFQNYLVSMDLLRTSPYIGVGPGRWGGSTASFFGSDLYDYYGIRTSQADSNWLSMVVEFGILGSLAFLWLLYRLFKIHFSSFNQANSRFWRGVAFGGASATIGFAILAIAAPAFENQQIAFYIWALAGINYSLHLKIPEQSQVNVPNQNPVDH